VTLTWDTCTFPVSEGRDCLPSPRSVDVLPLI